MNVLFLGPYRQLDGWGEASRRYLQALCKTDHNVRAHFTKLGHRVDNHFNNEVILQAESNSITNFDCTIHYMPIQFIKPNPDTKNIGFFHYETSSPNSLYNDLIKSLDRVIVSTEYEKNGIYDNIYADHIPVPIYPQEYNVEQPEQDKEYTFYFVGEASARKNLNGLIRAFSFAFSNEDNVQLVIKSNLDENNFTKFVHQSLSIMRKRKSVPKIRHIGNFLSRNDMIALHKKFDCFISLSFGESICLPMIDALMVGNQCIVTGDTGMDYYQETLKVSSFNVPCFCPNPPMQNIYTGEEMWREPNLEEAISLMRSISKGPRDKYFIDMSEHNEDNIIRALNETINKL